MLWPFTKNKEREAEKEPKRTWGRSQKNSEIYHHNRNQTSLFPLSVSAISRITRDHHQVFNENCPYILPFFLVFVVACSQVIGVRRKVQGRWGEFFFWFLLLGLRI